MKHSKPVAIVVSTSALLACIQAAAGDTEAEFFRLLNSRQCEELSKLVLSAPEAKRFVLAVYGHERDEAMANHWKQVYELTRPPPARDP